MFLGFMDAATDRCSAQCAHWPCSGSAQFVRASAATSTRLLLASRSRIMEDYVTGEMGDPRPPASHSLTTVESTSTSGRQSMSTVSLTATYFSVVGITSVPLVTSSSLSLEITGRRISAERPAANGSCRPVLD